MARLGSAARIIAGSKFYGYDMLARKVLERSWSVALFAMVFGVMVVFNISSEPARAVAVVFGLGLLLHSWSSLCRHIEKRRHRQLLGLVLGLLGLGCFWLGLNVVRFYTYAGDSPPLAYAITIRCQDYLVGTAAVVACVVFYWFVAEAAVFLANRISRRFVGRRNTWWNRPLKTWWMLASPIGVIVAALVTSSLLRWTLIACCALGPVFAALFRITRPRDQI